MGTPSNDIHLGLFDFAGAGSQSVDFDLEQYNPEGFFSLQGRGTGAVAIGLIDVTYSLSLNGVNFIAQTTPIMENLGTNGSALESFSPKPARIIRFIFTADGPVAADFWFHFS